MSAPEADIVAEGRRLLALAGTRTIPLRLLGGVAVRVRAPAQPPPPLERAYGDLDFIAGARSSADVMQLFADAGYGGDDHFNALHGKRRLVFFDRAHGRKVDVFVGEFSLCHRIPLDARLEVDPLTVPLAELLLTKLQIVELNDKDVRDVLALLEAHPVADDDGESVNAGRVATLCAGDWGLWRTITANLGECGARAGDYALDEQTVARIRGRIEALLERLAQEPKSRAWRLRARVGERKRWYDLPEEPGDGV